MPNILIVEDDTKIAALLADYMNAAGWQTLLAADGRSAVDIIRNGGVDLVLLDLMLPELDGIGVCREVRLFSQLPIIMLTARVDEIDRLLGLDSGADDYVCKPFSPREVVARVRVHLRRSGATGTAAAVAMPTAPVSPFQIDRAGMRVLHKGAALALTPLEFRLLAELIDNPSRVYTRQQLLDFAHQDQRDISDRTVDSHIKNIRRKLPDAECLQSVYGVGYRFEFNR
ncbi:MULTISPECIES: response regulator [unclassified Duganella]|uniref:response regulator n=1 Tax=unclassified Duganella TaxID=2636909 RepID=UPI000E3441C7|nr:MULTISPECIES: response regulator [unclassified Duganella]RFP16030.1 response regulator [Duganella sp. BJB475]RFP32806.1 response regulator [Duganella sp. BJB476]